MDDLHWSRPLQWTAARPGLRAAAVETVTLDQVVDMRSGEVEALCGLRDIPTGRLESLHQELPLESIGLLLEAEPFVTCAVVDLRFELEVRRFDLQEALSGGADRRRFDGVGELANVARPL